MKLHAHAADDADAFAEINRLAWPSGWTSGMKALRDVARAIRT
jgi:hypothetical protein